eukprot:5161562-Alexandrium_andersonii.AAC.1
MGWNQEQSWTGAWAQPAYASADPWHSQATNDGTAPPGTFADPWSRSNPADVPGPSSFGAWGSWNPVA